MANRTRSSISSPLSSTSRHSYDPPPAFASTDPHIQRPNDNASTVDDNETMDSEMARDLKDMYINRYQ
jgi:hypothetical protein